MEQFSEAEIAEIKDESARAYDLDRAHVFHSWSAQRTLNPMTVSRAAGPSSSTVRAGRCSTSPPSW